MEPCVPKIHRIPYSHAEALKTLVMCTVMLQDFLSILLILQQMFFKNFKKLCKNSLLNIQKYTVAEANNNKKKKK